ncbi:MULTISPECIES: fatty acyl-AMP ligase [unclassified Streptomyces]|uniref:fatty acyl-AMP ligase n=1 Tax=unclassified Streptomyces TaxID=2593676 RepID=UPI002E14FCDA|nr:MULTISPECIES: fatty acyl-AMP ligase [unclassified Streptomyces]WSJ34767.1 fatty acyl-AMP ligase [Streptomyces sp. NBC_01321]WSP61209.1 fatty acyl-AMP ligase [Streptomyces sp. NBC_01240]
MSTPSAPPGLVAAVREAARHRPDTVAMTFVDYSTDRAGTRQELTYDQLHTRARAVAGALSAFGTPGDRAAILCPHTADYVAALLGCLYTGMLAVPLYAPDGFRTDERLQLAMADCAPAVVLTTTPYEEETRALSGKLPGDRAPRVVCVDRVEPALVRSVLLPVVEHPDATAYLQYTSGSTRSPAGIEVTHRNLATGAAQLRAGLGIDEGARIAGWLPFFHDMGLLLMIAVPLIAQVPAVLMPPFAFVQQPARWLRLMSAHQSTHTVSPNFGLDLCVDRVTERGSEGLDLSALRTVVNGSEPVRGSSLRRFTDRFAVHGFRHEAHCPSYGLAEATLAVTIGTPAAPRVLTLDRAALAEERVQILPESDAAGYPVVACGVPADQDVRIVAPQTRTTVPDGRTGEVWVRGANVCDGYWGRPERTAEVFGAALADGSGDAGGSWLRTGDLGFLHGGELYLTGRLKDLIVVDGRNHHPPDLELTVQESDLAVRRGHVAAFCATLPGDGAERAVVIAELDRPREVEDPRQVRAAVRTALLSRHSLDVPDVFLVRRGTIPKTTSGKIRRAACRELYLSGALSGATVDGAR